MKAKRIKVQGPKPAVEEFEVDDLIVFGDRATKRAVAEALGEAAMKATERLFSDPEKGQFINLRALKTDANVVIIRRDTLHAMLRAASARTNVTYEFRRAGYEAGALYGVGFVGWLLDHDTKRGDAPRWPETPFTLVDDCRKIDVMSRWADIRLPKLEEDSPTLGFSGAATIRRDFLAHELLEEISDARRRDRSGAGESGSGSKAKPGTRLSEARSRYHAYVYFWEAYLEGTFTSALGAWFAKTNQRKKSAAVPLCGARCERREENEEELSFDFRVEPVRNSSVFGSYVDTLKGIQRHLLAPYLEGNHTTVLAWSRPVLDGYIRQMLGLNFQRDNRKENFRGLFEWLRTEGPETGRVASLFLSEVRDDLHYVHHNADTTADAATYEQSKVHLRRTVGSILMAMRDIQLSADQKREAQRIFDSR